VNCSEARQEAGVALAIITAKRFSTPGGADGRAPLDGAGGTGRPLRRAPLKAPAGPPSPIIPDPQGLAALNQEYIPGRGQ